MREIARIKDLRVTRIQSNVTFCLDVPSFEVCQGEFVGVSGPTGCGKSTLLEVLALVLRPDYAGEFYFSPVRDKRVDLVSASNGKLNQIRRESLGYVLQNGGLLDFLSIRENILLPARLKGKFRKSASELRALAERLGIEDQLGKLPNSVSGGQRQRAAIARSIIHQPCLVIADEPTASVDRQMALTIVEELKKLTTCHGVSVVMVTHDTGLIAPPIASRHYSFKQYRSSDGKVLSRCHEVLT
jgi:putative ABC transport system ATP-binding protein